MTNDWVHRTIGPWSGSLLDHWAFPMGGIGAGMMCLEGRGSLSHVSLRHRMERYHEPLTFAAIALRGRPASARVIEGPVPRHRIFAAPGGGLGCVGKTYGLPRFTDVTAKAQFPFCRLDLNEPEYPLEVMLVGWSPFTPPDADAASLPVAALEYTFRNRSAEPIEAVFSFNSVNFLVQEPGRQIMAGQQGRGGTDYGVTRDKDGFTLWERGRGARAVRTAACRISATGGDVAVNPRWFRGAWYDAQTVAWSSVEAAEPVDKSDYDDDGAPSPGGSLFVQLRLEPGEHRTVTVRLAWYVPYSDLRYGAEPDGAPQVYEPGPHGGTSRHLMTEYVTPPVPSAPEDCYRPWYASAFADIDAVSTYWSRNYDALRRSSLTFAHALHDSTLPDPVLEAVSANLSILKSPTVMRQHDGRFWAWEGCRDDVGSCFGSCTHVWNYAHAIAHLFPALERSAREAEFTDGQNGLGHQVYRLSLPLRPALHDFLAAADGQLGGIVKCYRDWRISGDIDWLRKMWPSVRSSLDYCIEAWDPDKRGRMAEPRHVTYDIEFWGPDSLTMSFYAAALAAAIDMGAALGESVQVYRDLLPAAVGTLEGELYNGEYYQQTIEWKNARRTDPTGIVRHPKAAPYSPEALSLLEREGPKYQYGSGCLADGVIGDWMARASGLRSGMDAGHVRSHLRALRTHNFRPQLQLHVNPQRPGYALSDDGGLLICTWPRGGQPILPFIYSNEVWTGIEYQVAAHLTMCGEPEAALDIVAAARRRYDGRSRNPFNEYECGHFYARALASWTLLQAFSGARYDAVTRQLHVQAGGEWASRVFIATATGYGIVERRGGQVSIDIRSGTIPIDAIVFDHDPS